MQDLPSLLDSLHVRLTPSGPWNPCHAKDATLAQKWEEWDLWNLYPSIRYVKSPSSTLGIRISSVEFVKNTNKVLPPQSQFDHQPFDTLQDTCPWRWISLTASIWPLPSTINAPNWLSLAPKHTGFEFSLRHGRSAINQMTNGTGEILKTHGRPFRLQLVGLHTTEG